MSGEKKVSARMNKKYCLPLKHTEHKQGERERERCYKMLPEVVKEAIICYYDHLLERKIQKV